MTTFICSPQELPAEKVRQMAHEALEQWRQAVRAMEAWIQKGRK